MRFVTRDEARNWIVPMNAVIVEETTWVVKFEHRGRVLRAELVQIDSGCEDCIDLWMARIRDE